MAETFATVLETPRLRLVDFTAAHGEVFAAMNSDSDVMEFFPAPLSRAESDGLLSRLIVHRQTHGFAPFALHQKSDDGFVGFTGLMRAEFPAHFTPAVEIGWRFAKFSWGQGLGPEAAQACLRFGFERLGLDEIVSFTALQNKRSIRVMQKIGMTHDAADDFDHPNVPRGDRLCRHLLYRMRRD